MLEINRNITLDDSEIDLSAVRSQGAGGQNVNKVASAIHLRFDIAGSSLPGPVQARLLALKDQRINSQGVIVIKAQNHRTQERNRQEALERLRELIRSVLKVKRKRVPTKPSLAAKKKRLEQKAQRSQLKSLRKKVID